MATQAVLDNVYSLVIGSSGLVRSEMSTLLDHTPALMEETKAEVDASS